MSLSDEGGSVNGSLDAIDDTDRSILSRMDAMEESKETTRGVVDEVQEFFYANDEFADFFEKWCEQHATSIDLTTEECKLEYTTLYHDFLRNFEDKIEEFIESRGYKVEDFYDELSQAEDDSDHDIFAQIMSATTDFDIFLQMMRDTAKHQQRK